MKCKIIRKTQKRRTRNQDTIFKINCFYCSFISKHKELKYSTCFYKIFGHVLYYWLTLLRTTRGVRGGRPELAGVSRVECHLDFWVW